MEKTTFYALAFAAAEALSREAWGELSDALLALGDAYEEGGDTARAAGCRHMARTELCWYDGFPSPGKTIFLTTSYQLAWRGGYYLRATLMRVWPDPDLTLTSFTLEFPRYDE